MQTKLVDHYGLHLSPNGLWFLLQNDEQNERGLANVRSNLEVKTYRSGIPTHSIRLGVGELAPSERVSLDALRKNPLGKLLLPNPDNAGQVAFIVNEKDLEYRLYQSFALSNPIFSPMRPAWAVTLGLAKSQARLTNIQPYIITEVTPHWMTHDGSQIISLFRLGTRPLILVGSSDVVVPSGVRRIKASASKVLKNISVETLQRIGATQIKEWARNAPKQ